MKVSVNPIAVLCTALVAACAVDAHGPAAGNTELNLDIVNPGGTSGELGFSIDRVDYRITCAGNPAGSYPIPDADTSGNLYNYDDSVDISGAFEVVDTRVPPVWQAVMDLPPGDCTITLSVYEDDEIVCVGTQTLAILEDGTTKYDIVLVCSLSIDLPDGMADVDGTFEFITGNLCPKLYVVNAIEVDVCPNPQTGFQTKELQYRAKDPDNTCGNNCDPQSCTGDNPPVCTPYPSNINDPACNPHFGGDPNSVDCQTGVYAGLVCTIAAIPTATGIPGGTFISPADGVTLVGPVLPVNLNLASGVPGIILPGLGGPAGTNAANSPAYPPLPNANGSLPPLVYVCDAAIPGPVTINLDCSDGDAECDQNKQTTVVCGACDFCVADPVDCSASAECLTDGVCDNACDPVAAGNGLCDRCPAKDNPAADGTPCTGGVCNGGVCDPTCPRLTRIVVTPLQADVGDQIGVLAEAASQDGGPLNYSWTATAGSFADGNSAITTYLCEEAGRQVLSVTVSNAAGSCTDQRSVSVTCVAATDVDPPILTDFDFNPKSVNVSTQAQSVTCTMSATDVPSGVNTVGCYFQTPSGSPFGGCAAGSPPPSGDRFDGVWTCSVQIPQNGETGTWTVSRVDTYDEAGNMRRYLTPELQTLGFPTDLTVTSGP